MIRAQPCWLRVVEDGKVRRRAPDFAVLYRGRAEIHEVKQDAECWKTEIQSELLAIRDEVERHPSWRYSVSLESALKAEPLRSNTDLLWRALRPIDEIDGDFVHHVTDLLGNQPLDAAELIERIQRSQVSTSKADAWDKMLTIVALGFVHFDVREHLTPASVVWNRDLRPPRERTLPFGTVEAAIAKPDTVDLTPPFCSLALRIGAQ